MDLPAAENAAGQTASSLRSRLLSFAVAPVGTAQSWFAVPLRLIVGYGFFSHGMAKLERGADHFSAILAAIGMPFADLLSWATIIVEIVGGLMLLAGALIPLAAVPMIIIIVVATLTVHLPNGFSSIKLMSFDSAGAHFGQPGYETDLLYLACLVALCVGGPGPYSIDAYLARRRGR